MNDNRKEYSKAIVKLFKGTVDSKSSEWEDIIQYQNEIQNYVSVIGLELILRKDEGYAYLKQIEYEDNSTLGLVTRRNIGFEVSIVLIVLRQMLEEHDTDPTYSFTMNKIVSLSQITEGVEMFIKEKYNNKKFIKDLNTYINRAKDYGFLKEMDKNNTDPTFRIERIIKDKISLDDMKEFDQKLKEYADSI